MREGRQKDCEIAKHNQISAGPKWQFCNIMDVHVIQSCLLNNIIIAVP